MSLDFLTFAEKLAPYSHSQRLQDVFSLWCNGFDKPGYFVELGALGGILASNTYLLEQLGWQGLVAEPHPAYGGILRRNRKCLISTECVWTRDNDTVEFLAVQGKPALSGISSVDYDDIQNKRGARKEGKVHTVATVTLNSLLEKHGAPQFIDFLSVDTEGSELSILQSFDFSRFTFGCICVEHGYSSHREPLLELLTSKGYSRIFPELSGHDDWYLHSGLAAAPDSPARDLSVFSRGFCSLPLAPKLGSRLRILRACYKNLCASESALRMTEKILLSESATTHDVALLKRLRDKTR